ncbi:hypothetical protein ACO1O0_000495 [Amphichorda felina]
MAEPLHTTTSASPSSPKSGARRSSSGFMPSFDSLSQQRRSEASVARRQSISDQAVRGGIFSQFFHNNFGRNSK